MPVVRLSVVGGQVAGYVLRRRAPLANVDPGPDTGTVPSQNEHPFTVGGTRPEVSCPLNPNF
jgi:hypothetical protein